ncbi:MAG: hypothetical protein WCC04_17680, partial [Terriglobales bacterium]
EDLVQRVQSWLFVHAFQDDELLAEGKVLQYQATATAKSANEGSEPEPKKVRHGSNVIADRLAAHIPKLLISKADGFVARDRVWFACITDIVAVIGAIVISGLQYKRAAIGEVLPKQRFPTDHLLSYLRIDPEGWFVLPVGTALLQLIRLCNAELANPVTANNVRAKISYTHANGRDVFVVPEATWRVQTRRGNEFPSKVFIDSNTEARLVLLGEDQSVPRKWFVLDLQSGSRKELAPGHWDVTVSVTSDNCAPYSGKGGFTITPGDYHLAYDKPDLVFSYEPAVAQLTLSPNDPRIRVEATCTMHDDYRRETNLVLHNEGGSTAYLVRVDDIDLTTAKSDAAVATSPMEDNIPPTGQKTVLPMIKSQFASWANDMVPFLMWMAGGSKEFRVLYRDYNGDYQFETTAELVYVPLVPEDPNDMIKQFHRRNAAEVIAERKERRAQNVSEIQIKNHRFRKVGNH